MLLPGVCIFRRCFKAPLCAPQTTNDMRFLLSTYSTAFLASGGGESEQVQIAETITDGGLHADIYGIQSRPLDFYDAVMHFSVQADGWAFFDAVTRRGTPVLLWPNVWWLDAPDPAEIARIQWFVDKSHRVLFKSGAELNNFCRHVHVPPHKLLVLPICVSARFSMQPDLGLTKTLCDLDNYVLCLGRVEPVKNQLNVIRALKELGLQGLMVGGHSDAAYFQQCKLEAGDSVQFLPFVKPCSQVLLALLAGSRIVAEPSFDPAGRSSLEAALVNKPLVLSRDEWVEEYFGETVFAVDPTNVDEIAEALALAAADASGPNKSLAARSRIAQGHASEQAIDHFITTLVDACDA